MKSKVSLGSMLFSVILLVSLVAGCKSGTEVREARATSIPVPAGASEELQAVIKSLPQVSYEQAVMFKGMDADFWKKYDEQSIKQAEEIEAEYPTTVEKETIAGVAVYRITPQVVAPEHREHLFVYLHGGGYFLGSGEASKPEALVIANYLQIPTIAVDYRQLPLGFNKMELSDEGYYQEALEDVLKVYKELLTERAAGKIAIGGTSAGGGLTLASIHNFKKAGLELPGAIYAGTPWADLTKTGDSYYINEGIDHVLITNDGIIEAAARAYAGGEQNLKNPLVSPIYGEFEDFPPAYLVTGTRDLFLSSTARLHTKMRRAGVAADIVVVEGMAHADYLFHYKLPESKLVYAEMNRFLLEHLQ